MKVLACHLQDPAQPFPGQTAVFCVCIDELVLVCLGGCGGVIGL